MKGDFLNVIKACLVVQLRSLESSFLRKYTEEHTLVPPWIRGSKELPEPEKPSAVAWNLSIQGTLVPSSVKKKSFSDG